MKRFFCSPKGRNLNLVIYIFSAIGMIATMIWSRVGPSPLCAIVGMFCCIIWVANYLILQFYVEREG